MGACQNQKENLVLYAYGELDSNSVKEIETHLAICKSCSYEYKRLSALLGKIKETVKSPVLSPQQVKALVTNIKWKLKESRGAKWWRRYIELEPARMIPVVATACILIVTAGILGYVKINETRELQPYAEHQGEGLILSDSDLEIVDNLEFLKEMDAIQKLSQVVNANGEINPQGKMDTETRGMRQDAHRKYFV